MRRQVLGIAIVLAVAGTAALGQFSVSTIAGTDRLRDGHPAVEVPFRYPYSVASDRNGGFFVADRYDYRIRRVNASGVIETYVGTGNPGYSGDGGPAHRATVGDVSGIAVDLDGNLYIADMGNFRVRKVDQNGIITTIAGSGNMAYGGDSEDARRAGILPTAVAVDRIGNIYAANAATVMKTVGNDLEVRLAFLLYKVDPTGRIQTVAGIGYPGFSGDGGPATSAKIGWIGGIAVDTNNNIYLADSIAKRVRKIDSSGIITTIAGDGNHIYRGDGVQATSTALDPHGIAVNNASGDVFVADFFNCRVRRIAADSGVISTVAGSGYAGLWGDGKPAVDAALSAPTSVAFDGAGDLLIADGYNSRVRKVTADGRIRSVAGTSIGDGGQATNAFLYAPAQMAIHPSGDLYFADMLHHRIRKIDRGGGHLYRGRDWVASLLRCEGRCENCIFPEAGGNRFGS